MVRSGRTRNKILVELMDNGQMKARDISRILKITRSAANQSLLKLKIARLVINNINGWTLTDEGEDFIRAKARKMLPTQEDIKEDYMPQIVEEPKTEETETTNIVEIDADELKTICQERQEAIAQRDELLKEINNDIRIPFDKYHELVMLVAGKS